MQLVLNAIVSCSVTLLLGMGFALIFRTTRFFHFAHGAIFALGAYSLFLLKMWCGQPTPIALVLAVVLAATFGCMVELVVYRPLRTRGASPLVLLLASLGLYVVLQNALAMTFGDETKSIRSGVVTEGLSVLGARIMPVQLATICTSAVLVAALAVFLKCTKMGKAVRAVADDAELAKISGIASDRVILAVFAIGSALAGVAGILVAMDVDMTPTMGMTPLMLAVVAVVIGGVDSIPGLVLAAVLVGAVQQAGAWWIGSQWQDTIVFAVLLAFLLLRPRGFLGGRLRKASV